MFDTYNRDFDDKLESVINAHDTFMKELRELRENYHEKREYVTGGVDLTEVDYCISDNENFVKDIIKPIRDQHQELMEEEIDLRAEQYLSYAEKGIRI